MTRTTWKPRAAHLDLADVPRPRPLTADTVFLYAGIHQGRRERFGWWQWLPTPTEAADYV